MNRGVRLDELLLLNIFSFLLSFLIIQILNKRRMEMFRMSEENSAYTAIIIIKNIFQSKFLREFLQDDKNF